MARWLEARAELHGKAFMRGRLFHLGRFPGMRPARAAEDRVRGEVYRLLDAATALAYLDAYEGPDFERILGEAELGAGEIVCCWAYLYRPQPLESQRIASGDFLA